MKYDFDEIIDRKNTDSLKFDFWKERGATAESYPFWVADMDFRTPHAVVEALKERAEHGIFGYSEPRRDYFSTLTDWFEKRHRFSPAPEKWIVDFGVVHALCSLIAALTAPDDGVLLISPVYYPFYESITENGRKLVVSDLIEQDGFYSVDFADFERKIVQNHVKMFLLCSPHNPVGRVWTQEELRAMGEICIKHGVFVVSDEIHADFVFEGRHTVFASLGEAFAQNCAVCTAPTKSFNLAGLHVANIYIPDDGKRDRVKKLLDAQGYSQPNVMGITACKAAYRFGGEWLDELLCYLRGNIEFLCNYIKENIPALRARPPQGTYLVWLDCKQLRLSDEQLHDFMIHKAKIWPDDGVIFGKNGSGYERINIACPRAVLAAGLERLKKAVASL